MLVVPLAGCDVDRGTDCRWPAADAGVLDPADPADARHLLDDVRLAEDLAIRYGDVRWAPGPVRWELRDEQCLNPSLGQIAARHEISLETVLSSRARLDDPRGFDPPVDVPIVLLASYVGLFAIRRVTKRFPYAEEPLANGVATVIVATLIGGVTLAFGRLWEGGIAAFRLGTDHLSYRGLRLQWTQHPIELFLIGVTTVWIVALVYFRARRLN